MKRTLIASQIILMLLIPVKVDSCSTFYATIGSSMLAGNSEDWDDLKSMVKFFPASTGKFGKFIFGFEDWGLAFCSWGGVNDQGLFYDWLSTGKRNPNFHAEGTLNYPGILSDKMLEECTTVEEAIALFQKYNCPGIGGAHILIADRFGNSAVIEEGENNSIAVIRKTGDYQIATNFLNSYLDDPEIYRWVRCPRYEYIDQTLYNRDTISVDLFQNILQHVGSNRNTAPTIYTNIYDFRSGKMYIYNYYNFDEVLMLDIKSETEKGYRFFQLPDLFSHMKTIFPINGTVIHSASTSLSWAGNATEYEIVISTDKQFTDPVYISYIEPPVQKAGFTSVYIVLCLFIVIIIGAANKKKILLAGICATMLFTGCENVFTELPETSSDSTHVKTIHGLNAGQEYFWKVVAFNNNGFQTETAVATFTTSDF